MENINLEKVDLLIEKYRGDTTAYISLLQDINKEFRYLPEQVLRHVAQKLDVPLSRLFSMATFYKSFNLTPRGEHEIHVCMGTACHVRGAHRILDRFSEFLQISPGETDPGGKYTLETVNCLGACALGPLATIDGKYYGRLTLKKAEALLEGYHEKADQQI
jgi:NADH-quinone oxidoreductase subunit E